MGITPALRLVEFVSSNVREYQRRHQRLTTTINGDDDDETVADGNNRALQLAQPRVHVCLVLKLLLPILLPLLQDDVSRKKPLGPPYLRPGLRGSREEGYDGTEQPAIRLGLRRKRRTWLLPSMVEPVTKTRRVPSRKLMSESPWELGPELLSCAGFRSMPGGSMSRAPGEG